MSRTYTLMCPCGNPIPFGYEAAQDAIGSLHIRYCTDNCWENYSPYNKKLDFYIVMTHDNDEYGFSKGKKNIGVCDSLEVIADFIDGWVKKNFNADLTRENRMHILAGNLNATQWGCEFFIDKRQMNIIDRLETYILFAFAPFKLFYEIRDTFTAPTSTFIYTIR